MGLMTQIPRFIRDGQPTADRMNQILETARRLGIPVVITNDRGESPQVVMPFEDFVAMTGVGSGQRAKGTGQREDNKFVAEEEVAEALANLTAERIAEETHEAAHRYHADRGNESTNRSFLEEKFYLEPIEDEEKD